MNNLIRRIFRKSKDKLVMGVVESASNTEVMVKLNEGDKILKEGEFVSVAIPSRLRLSSGKDVDAVNIIAQGKISNNKGGRVLIKSNRNNRIISNEAFNSIVPHSSLVGIKRMK